MEEYQDRSLRGRVFRHLREDILNGVYKNHEELREVTIGEELGVSRTPVREALRQLELEGLVTIIPNKGAYVTAITSTITQYSIHSFTICRCQNFICIRRDPDRLNRCQKWMVSFIRYCMRHPTAGSWNMY